MGQSKKQKLYEVKRQKGVSKSQDEVAAVLYAPQDSFIVYASQKANDGFSSPETDHGEKLFTVLRYKLKGGKDSESDSGSGSEEEKVTVFDAELNTGNQEGPVSFTADYKTMVFSQQWEIPKKRLKDPDPMGLFFGENVDGNWINIRPFEHNDPLGWLFSPSISPDGKTIYFSAIFGGTDGDFDLYRSELKGDAWTEPENLGPGVNTPMEEIYPNIHPSGRLYFSSNGHDNNRAGYDLFETTEVNGKWIMAEKLPSDFNTNNNEYHVWFSEDMRTGYLSRASRGGSKDVYEITTNLPPMKNPKPIKKTYYRYRIFDRKLDTVDTNLFSYSWTINDTLELPGHEVIYRFPAPGSYVCSMNVYDIELDTLLKGQTVQTLNIKLHEQAVISCPDTIQVGIPVDFDASQSYLPGFDAGRYVWDFGEGEGTSRFGEGIIISHTYNLPGKFKVILGVEAQKLNRNDVPEVRKNFKEVVVISE